MAVPHWTTSSGAYQKEGCTLPLSSPAQVYRNTFRPNRPVKGRYQLTAMGRSATVADRPEAEVQGRSTITSLPIRKLAMSLPESDDCKSIDVLLNEWRSQVVREAGHFVEDGVVCQDNWHKAKRRVLFLLKEPNGYKGENGPLNELLRKAATTNPGSAMWDRPTFHNIGRWAYGLVNYSHDAPCYQDANKAYKTAVLECAYIRAANTTYPRSVRR